MKCKVIGVLAAAFLFAVAPARAYEFEFTPILTYQFITDFDDVESNAIDRVDIDDSDGWGLNIGMNLSPYAGIELLWDHTSTDVTVVPKAGPTPNATTLDIDQIHFGGLYYFRPPDHPIRPFVS